jgi:hypothetical protein
MPMSPHRPALAAILVAVVAVLSFGAHAARVDAAPPTPNPMVAVALSYDGTSQGQCWIFVKNVVREATGHEMGFDYRQGFFDAGAIEVSAADAQPGDIIQIANDADTSASADYNGLHTSIILANLGGGSFDVIDSNMNFDGVVHQRAGYNPAASAARYAGLSYHIYRITGTPGIAPPLAPSASAPKVVPGTSFQAGDHAVVVSSDGLRLRSAPSTSSDTLAVLSDRTPVTVTGAAVAAEGYHWVPVTTSRGDGYVAAEFLAKSDGGTAAPGTSSPTAAGPTSLTPPKPLMQFRNVVAAVASD